MPASCHQKEWPQPQALDLDAHNRDNLLMLFTGPDRLSIGGAGVTRRGCMGFGSRTLVEANNYVFLCKILVGARIWLANFDNSLKLRRG